MKNRRLIFSSWLNSKQAMMDLCLDILEFGITEAKWMDSRTESGDSYEFWSMVNQNGEEITFHPKGQQMERGKIIEALKISRPYNIAVRISGNWRDPYIANQIVNPGWGGFFDITSLNAVDFLIKFNWNYSNMWFSSYEQAEVLYSDYEFVKDYIKDGHQLIFDSSRSSEDRNAYIPMEKCLQENRMKILKGIAQYIFHFQPIAAALTYDLTPELDIEKRMVNLKNQPDYPAPLYYNKDEEVVSAKTLRSTRAHYFVHEVSKASLFLEEEHYSFLFV